ncbi:molecular chaperone DjlA [Malaciobacter molluscorum LMG 25693]|uniref:DnaJ-like membrane chaperone protein n=1 Tax=Malaciobacter molluscorum LMG 25693 TaxID=870501 RepID=A0A2G1DKI9_9BACT|nr:TerB family tellurite resistance protein [Malaciobacter molluscorum]AXX92555.1 DnaJ-like membrane chaperone protein [Malaciobacter molluscorum LMG 25693]PHO18980.1 molecular chaperone DjlA [Malaciobacter molluscorum LMG 25693]RXJ97284.1 molecular chaperone DjlA [Malaciobacter molluscorum]
MKFLFLLIVGFILFLISKNYKTEKFVNINLKMKEEFDGDLMQHEAGLLVALMAKVAKADGQVSELEAQLIKHTLGDISRHFKNEEEIREKLKEIYNKEKSSFDNTIEVCKNLYNLTSNNYEKRVKIMEYLLNLAFIDGDFSNTELMITEDISNALKIKRVDFERLVNAFEMFYKKQKENESLSLDKAYEVLEASKEDDNNTIKKKYRSLVKRHHPDIIAGQGASQNIIDEATTKLQEINQAYELIKKSRGI